MGIASRKDIYLWKVILRHDWKEPQISFKEVCVENPILS